jgi:predicted DNA-binding transcriptional regulator YafY
MSMDDYNHFVTFLADARRAFNKAELAERFRCSQKTIGRYFERLTESGAVVAVQTVNGEKCYRLESHKLPGAWFDASSVRALSLMLELQNELGMLGEIAAFKGLRTKLKSLMHQIQGLRGGIVIKRSAQRAVQADVIHLLLKSIDQNVRITFSYQSRTAAQSVSVMRTVSAKQIEVYRGNWYLLGWCHDRDAWRYFALELIEQCVMTSAFVTHGAEPPAHRGYGIFDLESHNVAVLRFSPFRSQWIKDESWHADQHDSTDAQGCLIRKFPYGKDTELLRDLMREGNDVEVLQPAELREALAARHAQAAQERS